MWKTFGHGALVYLCGLACIGPAGAQSSDLLKPGDVVFIKVDRHDDLSTTTQVDGNGNVSLAYIGNVSVAGLSENQAEARVSQAFTAILKQAPRVTLSRTLRPAMGSVPRAEEMVTEVVPLDNSDAESLSNALQGMSTAGGSISFYPEANALVVTDTLDTVSNVLAKVRELDSMSSQMAQVRIEAWIGEVESGAIKELGVRWFVQGDNATGGFIPGLRQDPQVGSTRGNLDQGYNERINTGTNNNNTVSREFVDRGNFDRRLQIPVQVAAPGQMFFGFFNAGIDLGAFLDAMIAENKAESLATPYATTVNHGRAEIASTIEYPYTELATAGFGSVSSVRFLDIGVKLDVTPHVRRDPAGETYVRLELEPEVSTNNGLVNGVPVRSVAKSKSTPLARDGQTIVIGGIRKREARVGEKRIPVVGKIPVLGALFTHKERSKESRELLIFVTPKVIEAPEENSWTDILHAPEPGGEKDLISSMKEHAEAGDK